jgi:hypothetical protein
MRSRKSRSGCGPNWDWHNAGPRYARATYVTGVAALAAAPTD